ncbi:MAG: glycosyltransferase family 9 protein [Spirulina sp. SIO3F2]|nr:glycosyltransferase family 9 protein [Spirulina sp. SIO3F2]
MRILALVPGGIGDQVLFFPTLASLKAAYPEAKIDVLVEPRSKVAYRVCPSVHEVLLFDYKDNNGLADYLNLIGMLRDREYEAAVALGQRWSVGLLLWLNGIGKRVGYVSGKDWFWTDTVPLNRKQYAAAMYHDLVQGFGIDAGFAPPQLAVPRADIEWAEAQQQRLDIKEGYILIHGGSSQMALTKGINKIYPVQKWLQVVQDLQEKQPDVPVVIIKGPEDDAWVQEMITAAPKVKVVSPPDIGKLSALIAGANLMLCTDSGPMHLSIAAGTYTLALFGPTDMAKLLPPNSDRFLGVQSPTESIADIAPVTILEKIWNG